MFDVNRSRRAAVATLARGGAALALAFAGLPRAMAQEGTLAAVPPEGAAREGFLSDRARREAILNLYTSITPDDLGPLVAAFEKKHAVKVRVWRASSETIGQRALTEAHGGRFDVDVIETNGSILESLGRERLLLPVKAPGQAALLDGAVRRAGEWVGTRVNVFAQAYHTGKVKPSELPREYRDLLDPRWKGRLGIEAADYDFLAGAAEVLGEDEAVRLFRTLAATNGLSVRKGHTLLANLVASGEIPLALTVYQYRVEQLKQKGAPIDWFVIPPAIAHMNGMAIARRAPHPHAALLFYDFILGDGLALLAQRDVITSSRELPSLITREPVRFADPARMLDEQDKWVRVFNDIVTAQR